ncbi:MAG: hypothetical protein MUC63_07720 [Planctomycetes bacterium]|jgi:hypothetical protein|nr:hypothetical protein [Planctomycetota bacterium]
MRKDLPTIAYGLFTVWTGLFASIEAKAFKPNAFGFCAVTGVMAIASGFLLRLEKRLAGTILAGLATLFVLGFYVQTFVGQPEKDATVRVGMIIVASLAELVVLLLPARPAGGPPAAPCRPKSNGGS